MLMPLSIFANNEHDEKETFQSLMNLIVRSARERLRPLKTFRIEQRPSNNYWYEVTDVLPGSECRIYEHPRMVYHCIWTVSKQGGPANVTALLGEIERSSPGQWAVEAGKGITVLAPKEPRRYPLMEITGERDSKTGMQLKVFAVARE
jgi:hypothetical protein